jgi:hypothetical protein
MEMRLAGTTFGVAVALALASPAHTQTAEGLEVRFELNDAQVKGRVLPGVLVEVRRPGSGEVASGLTGPDGRFTARLAPGSYEVSYRLHGYVPYTSEATEVQADGQLVTVSLSRMLEATGEVSRDVRIILNWGSREDQVKDADSHLACPCQDGNHHVFFRNRVHQASGHKAELDVDDTDWGGPETITLTSPMNGDYVYWVHDYSGPPALLGTSDLVVRVLIGREQVGEFRVFKGLTRRAWRPFKAISLRADAPPSLVRFTEDEIAEGADLAVPLDLQPPDVAAPSSPACMLACPAAALVIGLAILLARRRRRRAR